VAGQLPRLRLSLHQRKFVRHHVAVLGMGSAPHDGDACTFGMLESVVVLGFRGFHREGRDRLRLEQVTLSDAVTSEDDVSSYVVVLSLHHLLPPLHPQLKISGCRRLLPIPMNPSATYSSARE